MIAWLRRTAPVAAIGIMALAFSLAGGGTARADPGDLAVSYRDGRLSLVSHGARLRAVLAAVAREVGFQVAFHGDFPAPVYKAYEDKPLDEALPELVGDNSMILILKPGGGAPSTREIAELWVMASGAAPGPVETDAAAADPDPPRSDPAPVSMGEFRSLTAGEQATVLDDLLASGDRASVDFLQLVAVGARDTALRAEAILALGTMPGDRALPVLGRLIFGSGDADVRWMAVRALGGRRSVAADALLAEAAKDADPWVRDEAIRALDRPGEQPGPLSRPRK